MLTNIKDFFSASSFNVYKDGNADDLTYRTFKIAKYPNKLVIKDIHHSLKTDQKTGISMF